MKKMLSGLVLASTFVLTACGGGDSDSSATNTQNSQITNDFSGNTEGPACKVTGNVIYVPNSGSGCGYQNKELTNGKLYVYDCDVGDVVKEARSLDDEPVVVANAPNKKDYIFEGKGVTVTCQTQ